MTPTSVPAPSTDAPSTGATGTPGTAIPDSRSQAGRTPGPRSPDPDTRRSALVAVAGLTAMAVVSPLAVFLALPDDRTTLAGALMLLVAVLDVVVALALVPVLSPAGRSLARTAAAVRIAYAAALAVASLLLLTGSDADRFTEIWDLALGVFGLSLLAVGVLLWRLHAAPRWLGALVVVAGLGYLVDAIVAALAPGALPELGAFTFVGEVALIGWLVVHALRARRRHSRPTT